MCAAIIREVDAAPAGDHASWLPRPLLPAGRRVELAIGAQKAAVTEVGSTLAAYSVEGLDLLDGFGPDETSTGGRGQPLLPWPNRLGDGRYELDGDTHQLPLDEVERHNAIHGLVRFASWNVLEVEEDRVLMGHVIHPRPGYPFLLATTIEHRLTPDGLAIEVVASNAGRRALPFGVGFHPYLRVGTATIDPLVLTVPARRRIVADDRGLPVGEEDVAGSDVDFGSGRRVGETVMDVAFTGFERDGDGLVRVSLDNPSSGRGVAVWMSPELDYVMCFTGDTLDEPHRRTGLAIEPMSCPPDAFRSGHSLVVLAPGERFVARWGLAPRW